MTAVDALSRSSSEPRLVDSRVDAASPRHVANRSRLSADSRRNLPEHWRIDTSLNGRKLPLEAIRGTVLSERARRRGLGGGTARLHRLIEVVAADAPLLAQLVGGSSARRIQSRIVFSLSFRRAAASSTLRYSGSSSAGGGVMVISLSSRSDATPTVRVRPCVAVGGPMVSFARSGVNCEGVASRSSGAIGPLRERVAGGAGRDTGHGREGVRVGVGQRSTGIVERRDARPRAGAARSRLSRSTPSARRAAAAMRDAHARALEAELAWRPVADSERARPPYELRPGTGAGTRRALGPLRRGRDPLNQARADDNLSGRRRRLRRSSPGRRPSLANGLQAAGE